MEFLEGLRHAWKFLGGSRVDEAWAVDETAFEEHFGTSFAEFEECLASLDQARTQLYERTLEVNPEAAVAWILLIS